MTQNCQPDAVTESDPVQQNSMEQMISYTQRVPFACTNGEGKVYLTLCELNGRPTRVEVVVGKTGTCERALLGALCNVINLYLEKSLEYAIQPEQQGEDLFDLVIILAGTVCEHGMCGVGHNSCVDALAQLLQPYLPVPGAPPLIEQVEAASKKVRDKRAKLQAATPAVNS